MTKAEKLARELISLRLSYTDRDFDSALDIIASGELFSRLIQVGSRIRAKAPGSSATLVDRRRGVRRPSVDPEIQLTRTREKAAAREDVAVFLDRFLNRQALPNGNSVRSFAEVLGLRLPKKPPARAFLAEKIVTALLQLSDEQRASALEQADRLSSKESSLQLWSNVIVRGHSGNR